MSFHTYLLSICLTIGICRWGVAQPTPWIGQFQHSIGYYNPAAAGSQSRLTADALYRNQWTSYPGAPQQQLIAADGPLGKNIGIGGWVQRYTIGGYMDLQTTLNVSYRVPMKNGAYLQFGLNGAIKYTDVGLSNAFIWDPADPTIQGYKQRGYVYKIGAGVWYKKNNTFLGLSCTDLFSFDPSKLFYDSQQQSSTLSRNYYALAGTKWYITEYMALLPSVLYSYYTSGFQYAALNIGLEFNQTFTAGIGGNTNEALGLFTRISVSPKFKIGYRYEYSFGAVQGSNFGTNEIQVSYGFH
ncbi:MAG: PorP/SprF family type IX secretion system membrane protein [Cytophagaceae bacterium]|jgi:type IX secretion system PorP/SprF family membrane protein|nr:PorP/SprF family type IX secretion system membrane protein [Cytophagaceae bacterium]